MIKHSIQSFLESPNNFVHYLRASTLISIVVDLERGKSKFPIIYKKDNIAATQAHFYSLLSDVMGTEWADKEIARELKENF